MDGCTDEWSPEIMLATGLVEAQ